LRPNKKAPAWANHPDTVAPHRDLLCVTSTSLAGKLKLSLSGGPGQVPSKFDNG